jgi:hypothetical protein
MTNDRTTSEGRALPRPQEELVDQGLAFDVGTLLSRRRLLGMLGLGATVGLAACGGTSGPIPGTAPTVPTCWSRAASYAATSAPASVSSAERRRACP